MSWRASAWALDEVLGIGANAKLVLLALCEFANDDNETWRSQSEIAKRAECEERTVRTHLKSLEEWGLISRRPRYRWCDSDDPACAMRPPHKHRSGTTYVVHMDRGVFNLAAFEASHGSSDDDGHDHEARGVDKQLVDNQPVNRAVDKSTGAKVAPVEQVPVDNSIPAKFAGVEETAVLSGKVHTGKVCRYEDGQGSIPANSRRPHRQEPATIRSYNPHINHQPTNQPSDTRFLSEAASRMVGGMDDQPSEDDVMLVRACLPPSWQALAVGTALSAVARALRAGLKVGWTPSRIEHALGQGPNLDGASNPAGLMIFRVRSLVATRPPASGTELRKQRQVARERELTEWLTEVLTRDENLNPSEDWMRLTTMHTHGLSPDAQAMFTKALERVQQRRDHWLERQKVVSQ